MAEYRLSPAALDDLGGIFDYTVRQWGLEQAASYTQLIGDACAAFAEAPAQASNCAHIRPGYRCGVVKQHVIYFRVEDYGIAVIRILHQHMDAHRHL